MVMKGVNEEEVCDFVALTEEKVTIANVIGHYYNS